MMYFYIFNFIKLIFVIVFFSITNQEKLSRAYIAGYRDGMRDIAGAPNI
jgi:hypothetical protein